MSETDLAPATPPSMPEAGRLSRVKAARREKILDAGQALFTRHGFRGTTMEGLAEAAGMSKVTLYGYFRDKDAVFTAVADRLAARIETAVGDALAMRGSAADRIAAALIAKHRMVHGVVRASSFAAELFSESERTSAHLIATLDAAIERRMADVLIAEDRPDAEARQTARLLFGAAQGVADHFADFEAVADGIDRLVRALVPPA